MSIQSLDPTVREVIKNPVEPYSSRVGTMTKIRALKEQLNPPKEMVENVELTTVTPPAPDQIPKIQSQLREELRHYSQIAPPDLETLSAEQQEGLRRRAKKLADAIVHGKPGSTPILTRQQHWEPYQENLSRHRAHEHDVTRHDLDEDGNWVFISQKDRNSVPNIIDEWRYVERTLYQDADREEMGWVGEMSTLLPDQASTSSRPSVSLSGISARDYLRVVDGDTSEMLPGPKKMLEHELEQEKAAAPLICGAETKSGAPCKWKVSEPGQRCRRHQ